MRRFLLIALCLSLVCTLCGCSASADERAAQAQGYGGPVKVRVAVENGKISKVEVTEHNETQGVGTRAIDALPDAMASAGTWDVDIVSGATVTSNALKEAVRSAMGEAAASPEATQQPQATAPQDALTGVGMAANGRLGPGKDGSGQPVYSFNVVFAQGTFEPSGKVLSLKVDQLEVATPNYDSETMPRFSGFPGQGDQTDEAFLEEVSAWTSKRQRGESYKLTTGTWQQQMDVYEQLFTGKTVEEIEAWFNKYCSDETGRPLKQESDNEADQAKYDALSDAEKTALADVTSSATMSLRDSHGDILTAIRRAWENARGAAASPQEAQHAQNAQNAPRRG